MEIALKLAAIFWGVCVLNTSWASDPIIFPAGGQSSEQMEQDKFQCYGWAKNESGFDPMVVPTATTAPPQQEAQKGGAGRGLLRGAALGGIVDGSDGAKTGAAAGAVIGGMRRRDQNKSQAQEQAQWEQQQTAIYNDNRNRYDRAYSACLESKDYTVR
jgi:hypothetical protein